VRSLKSDKNKEEGKKGIKVREVLEPKIEEAPPPGPPEYEVIFEYPSSGKYPMHFVELDEKESKKKFFRWKI